MSAIPDLPSRPPRTPRSSLAARPSRPSAVVIVGAGPRATGLVERLAANAPELYGAGAPPFAVHLVDPYPPGGGRIWRPDQSPLLWMNSMAEDVTMFTDASVEGEGPVRPGPSLAEWAARLRDGDLPDGPTGTVPPELAAEAAALTGDSFATRRLQSAYLRWVYERAVAALPPGVTVHEHRYRAVRITGPRDGRQQVWLEGRATPITADAVVLALGHLDAEPDAEQRALSAFAAEYGLVHLPPEFTADSDLDVLRPGEPVLVRGLGLAFVDLMVLLTEGRGGRYERGPAGELRYRPSGREPVLHVGSRRGVPYHAKIGYPLDGERPPVPRFFGPAEVDALLRLPGGPDFRHDIWPLIDKELGYAHYHRLFTAHPERTTLEWRVFEERYAARPPGDPALAALIASAVPDPADRLDLDALDHPLAGLRYPDEEALQQGLRGYIEADLARRHDPEHSPDLAVFLALLSVYGQLIRLGDIGGWWHGFFSYLASGPPGPRLEQLLALSRAGVVRFLGAGLTVTTDPGRGVFRASGDGLPGHTVEARALVEARLPEPTVERSRDPLLRSLHRDGAAATPAGLLAVSPDDGRVLDRAGRPHPRRFALGPHTDARASGAFARPRTNAPAFRQNDATARALLRCLRALAHSAPLSA
ncbi:FAD/NAD(P)-binding protein [Streptomyces sp. NEAU-Y11]|uniref:FAD/NAD(P)-binding protein n=1 Tax=Streptomyces cucumeris TaxID=2962890 RepID=UPI0020C8676A|nr:FAD/NAD(P)-binding domain-containing protein [Streptomyces sp. NEAU-Y11]MCP9208937.1 FAD/NAD(P)-binding protein [Streptomyces sp. NEAU-Y11]